MGRSRGQLVHRLLSSAFLPQDCSPQQADELVREALAGVSREGEEYSPFNLTVYNLRSGNASYMCSEWGSKNPLPLQQDTPYSVCNCDILTVWPKTAHGMGMFKQLLSQLADLKEEEVIDHLAALFRDNKRFSEVDDD
jgi:uncharacterized protein with NRDE domain